MKSLRSEISFNTLASISVVSALIIGLSIYVYEKLYVEFVSAEVDAISVNMAVDLIDYIDEPAGSFNQTGILLRLDEYEYAEAAYIFGNDGTLLSHYIGPAGFKGGLIKPQEKMSPQLSQTDIDKSIATLSIGLHLTSSKVIVVKVIHIS